MEGSLTSNSTPETGTKLPSKAVEERFVAILVSSGSTQIALEQVMRLFGPTMNFRCFATVDGVLDDILNGQVVGVIGINREPTDSAERFIRHNLSHRPGFDRAKADSYQLPPTYDCSSPLSVTFIYKVASQMVQGLYRGQAATDAEEKLSRERAANIEVESSGRSSEKFAPSSPRSVVIVDDEPHMARNMSRILEGWPNVSLTVIITIRLPEIPLDADIVLLDESMQRITGTQVYEDLQERGFRGLVASTTGGKPPQWVRHHFGLKKFISQSAGGAEMFIGFMNKLLSRLES